MIKTPGQRTREALSAFLRCAVLNGPAGPVAVMDIEKGVLFWEVSTGRSEVHFSTPDGEQLGLAELRDWPNVVWIREEQLVAQRVDSTTRFN